jgi:glycosyltransferase involved in cell wall biosynthesis
MVSPAELSVALEVSTLCESHRSGTGRYAISLIDALDRRGDVRVDSLLYRLSRWKKRHLRHQPARSRWYLENFFAPPGINARIIHGTDVRAPTWRRFARVITLHDVFHVLPFAHGWCSEEFRQRSLSAYKKAAETAHVIVSVSETTKKDFLAHYDFPAERVIVTPHGVDTTFRPRTHAELQAMRQRLGLTRPYILHVGALVKRKNLPALIKAYEQARLVADFDLVFVGGDGDASDELKTMIQDKGLTDQVKFCLYVSENDLPIIYAGAAVLAFPSLYEGFGMPILEAMMCDVPVVTSHCGGTAEIGASHACLIDPHDVESLASGLRQALAKTTEEKLAARTYAESFTWDKTAEKTVAAYRLATAVFA